MERRPDRVISAFSVLKGSECLPEVETSKPECEYYREIGGTKASS